MDINNGHARDGMTWSRIDCGSEQSVKVIEDSGISDVMWRSLKW